MSLDPSSKKAYEDITDEEAVDHYVNKYKDDLARKGIEPKQSQWSYGYETKKSKQWNVLRDFDNNTLDTDKGPTGEDPAVANIPLTDSETGETSNVKLRPPKVIFNNDGTVKSGTAIRMLNNNEKAKNKKTETENKRRDKMFNATVTIYDDLLALEASGDISDNKKTRLDNIKKQFKDYGGKPNQDHPTFITTDLIEEETEELDAKQAKKAYYLTWGYNAEDVWQGNQKGLNYSQSGKPPERENVVEEEIVTEQAPAALDWRSPITNAAQGKKSTNYQSKYNY